MSEYTPALYHDRPRCVYFQRPLCDAEVCRRNGWRVGTVLVGDEGHGPETIVLTAIGENHIMARQVAPVKREEAHWTLRCRDWKEVADDGIETTT